MSRAEYIRRAIERMNRETHARLHAERLAEVSQRVRVASMRINEDFAAVEHEPDAGHPSTLVVPLTTRLVEDAEPLRDSTPGS